MSPNLSFEHLAVILALAGCSKATPAADGTSTTVRSDPAASSAPLERQDMNMIPSASMTATAAAPMTGGRGGGPGGAASATDLRKKDHMANPTTGQASCGAGSCTSEIKKK